MPLQPPPDQFGTRGAAARLNSIRIRVGGLPTQPAALRRALSTEFLPVYFDAFEDERDWELRALRTAQWVARQWARREADLDQLLQAVYEATDDILGEVSRRAAPGSDRTDGSARRATVVGARIIAAVVFEYERARDSVTAFGARRRTEHEVLSALLGSGGSHGPTVHALADAYTLVAVRLSGAAPADVEEAFQRHGGPGTLCLLGRGGGHVVIPEYEPWTASATAERVRAELGGAGWLVVERGSVRDLPACRQRADILLTIAAALYDPGVYRPRDLVVEYTAVTTPSAVGRLVVMIDPVLSQPTLLRTLETLITAGGDRSRAARRLNVDRCVMDRLCLRIEDLTGQDLNDPNGLTTLGCALAAHSLCAVRPGER
ncbi:helix-turn-helix domain-containing protein [Streptomyces sp. NBC_00285]|uniref:helix-turn-helix domain-containing protein n=1 Tax=Streptomyces sp. NBC_00285 TaxID=2975700 RepID=UPI002E29D3BD|nr:helix-turn-helix domain-containing protein [Streptomyces sp. NBC_00285]